MALFLHRHYTKVKIHLQYNPAPVYRFNHLLTYKIRIGEPARLNRTRVPRGKAGRVSAAGTYKNKNGHCRKAMSEIYFLITASPAR